MLYCARCTCTATIVGGADRRQTTCSGTVTAVTTAFEPLDFLHGPTMANRFMLTPLTNRQSHDDGALSDDEIAWLTARAVGGFGLVMTAAAFVAPAGHVWEGQLGVANDDHLPGLRRLARNLRAAGACSSVQLHHGGRRAERAITGMAAQCPWDDPAHDAVAMTLDDIQLTIADFVAAAVRAEEAGFDGVELHGAHGYLLGQFMDSTRNHRTDAYGGSLDNRFRMVQEVMEGVRAATGDGFQLGLRLSPEGFGIPLVDGREYARRALDSGLLDYLELSLWDVFMSPRKGGDGLLIDHRRSAEGLDQAGRRGQGAVNQGRAVVHGLRCGLRVGGQGCDRSPRFRSAGRCR